MRLLDWLLTRRWQLTVQLLCGVLSSAVFTFIRPVHFPLACLSPVFVVIIIASLAQDQHVGSRLQVTGLLLGPTWLAVVLAGGLMTLAKLAESHQRPLNSGYIAAASVLALLGLVVLVVARAAAPSGPAKMMGALAAVMYGILVLISVGSVGIAGLWTHAVGSVSLAMLVATLCSLLVGFLVAPSLASDEVAAVTAEALRGAGAVVSYHTSLLMAQQQRQQEESNGSNKQQQSNKTAMSAPTKKQNSAVAGQQMAARAGRHMQQQLPSSRTLWQTQRSGRQLPQMMASTATAAVVDAAVAVHKACATPQRSLETLDWVVDELEPSAAGTPAPAAAGMADMQSSNSVLTERLQRHDSKGDSLDVELEHSEVQESHVQQDSSNVGAASSIHSTQSEHSVGDSSSSTSDATVTMHDSADKQLQQQQGVQEHEPDHAPMLSEELLQDAALPSASDNAVAAWAAAAAAVTASRQCSLVPAVSMESQDLDVWASTAAEEGTAARQSLEYAASLEFPPEMDDNAFLEMMRTLSRSKPYGSTASLDKLASNSRIHPARSAVSVVSTAGSVLDHLSPRAASNAGPAGLLLQQEDSVHWLRQHSQATSSSSWLRGNSWLSSRRLSSFLGTLGTGSFWTKPHSQQPTGEQHPQQLQQQADPTYDSSTDIVSSHMEPTARDPASPLGGAAADSRELNSHDVHLVVQQHVGFDAACTVQEPARDHVPTINTGNETASKEASKQEHLRSSRSVHFADADMDAYTKSHTGRPHSFQRSHDSDTCRLQAPLTSAAQLAPMIAAAKTALASARFEPNWLRPWGFGEFDADAWATLLEDAELVLVRVSTLEALSEERQLMGLQLDDLQHYKNMADAMSLILAQLSAFLADVSRELHKLQCNRHVASSISNWLGWGRGPGRTKAYRKQQQAQACKPASQPQQQKVPVKGLPSPFAADVDASQPRGTQQQPEFELQSGGYAPSLSAVLSQLERQQSGMSSYLWEKKAGWETGRQLLQHEMEAAVGAYWWAVLRASKKAPVRVPKSREVMTLTFVYPICNGLIDACERLEASAQRVLRSAHGRRSNGSRRQQKTRTGLQQTAEAGAGMGDIIRSRLSRYHNSIRDKWQEMVKREQQWMQPLLKLLLVQPGLQAMRQAVCVDLKTAVSSKENFRSLLRSRVFQAGIKLYLAAGSVLLATLLLMAYDAQIRSLAPLFGYTSVCLSMQERVEATTNKVVGRVLATIVGACMGLAINHIPGAFSSPALLLACVGLACIPLSMVARAQARMSVALAIITLLSVSLCAYEAMCCTTGVHMGSVDVFLTRMGAVVGACIYVALLNQLLLPWYASSYALEQMADALERAGTLFEKIYKSQHERMRLAAIASGAFLAGDEVHVAGQDLQSMSPNPAAPGVYHHVDLGAQLQGLASSFNKHNESQLVTGDSDTAGAARQSLAVQDATAKLAALEAAEADLHVNLRQEVLGRIVAVQMSLAKESVSWKRGVLVTPQVVLDVLGAMIECVEALASQRLALAPYTRQPEASATGLAGSHGLLRLSGHCYSIWAAPLHPCWLQTLKAVQELTRETAQYLRSLPAGCEATPAAASGVEQKLSELERCRLDVRHTWLDIRRALHKQVHAAQQQQAGELGSNMSSLTSKPGLSLGMQFLPTDSIHFFTFTYGASRVLNKLTGVSHAALNTVHHQSDAEL